MGTARGDQPPNRPGPAGKARRGTRRAPGRFQITAHALDGLLKHEAEFLADALSEHFHLPIPRIIRPFPTELPQLDLHIERLDNVFETVGEALLHLEHQSNYTAETLPRFLQYDAALHRATNKPIATVVIYGPNVLSAPSTIQFPNWTYRVHNIYLGRRDGDRVYRALQRALATGTPLTAGQRIDLVFQPLMRQKRRPQEQVFREAVEQAGRLPEPDQDRAIGSLLVLAYHTLGESALNDLMEELMTTNLLIKVLGEQLEKGFQQGLEQGVAQGLEQGVAQGLEQGVAQTRQEVILHILHRRYTTVPEPVIAQIRQITDPERLSALLDSATDAQSLDQFRQALEGQ
ncbi:MAG: hypothetical protein ACRDG4_16145 [Chloroflexota bacterium]